MEPPIGNRPVVLVSRDSVYERRQTVLMVPVTTRIRGLRSELPLGPENGLPRRCVANADSLTTVDKGSLYEFVGILAPSKVDALDLALRFALGLH